MKYRDIQYLILLFSGLVSGYSCEDYPQYEW